MALTDDLNLFAAPSFAKACAEVVKRESGEPDGIIKPIIGCDLGALEPAFASDTRHNESGEGEGNSGGWFGYRPLLLALDDAGYGNLCSLLSVLNGVGKDAWVGCAGELLAARSGGLAALSGGRNGELTDLILTCTWSEARACAEGYREIFGKDRYWLELVPRGFIGWRRINEGLLRLSRELDLGLVASNDVRFTRREDRHAFEIFAREDVRVDADRRRPIYFGREAWLKSAREMEGIFGHVSGALVNSLRIAEMVEYRPGGRLPTVPLDDNVAADPPAMLACFAEEGLLRRYGPITHEDTRARLAAELTTSERLGLAPWFLVAKDYVDYARSVGIGVGPGRGTLTGSLIAYCISITDLDPVRYGLRPDQFFADAGRSFPSFDLDFEFGRRQEVIDHVAAKWGQDRVASIPTFTTLGPAAALRMAGSGLGYPEALIREATDLLPERYFPRGLLQRLVDAGESPKTRVPARLDKEDSREALLPLEAFLRRSGRRRRLLETAAILEGLYSRVSLHPCGLALAGEAIEGLVPLFRERTTGAQVVQCPLEHLEKKGIAKFNFLGLKTLDEITYLERLIQVDDPDFDLGSIAVDDIDTWRLIMEGATDGIFLLDSGGFRSILRECRPSSLIELALLDALYRPGAMNLIPVLRSRKMEGEPYALPNPALEPVLRESFGIPVFQEHIALAIAALTGCTGAEGERLRSVFASRRSNEDEIATSRAFFIGAMMKLQGGSLEEAVRAFEFLCSGAPCCYKKSHALAMCLIAYRQVWLHAHYPALATLAHARYSLVGRAS